MSENLNLLYNSRFSIRILGERNFDLKIILKKRVLQLHDLKIDLKFPNILKFDKLIELVREIDLKENEIKEFLKSDNINTYNFTKNLLSTDKPSHLVIIDSNLSQQLDISEYIGIPLGDVVAIKKILQNNEIRGLPLDDNYLMISSKNINNIAVDNFYKPLWFLKLKNNEQTILTFENLNTSTIKELLNNFISKFITNSDEIYFEYTIFLDEPYYLKFQYPSDSYELFLDELFIENNQKYYIPLGYHKIRLFLKDGIDLSSIEQPYVKVSNQNNNTDFYDLAHINIVNNLKIGYSGSSYKYYPDYLNEFFTSSYILVKDITQLIDFVYSYTPKIFLSNSSYKDYFDIDLSSDDIGKKVKIELYKVEYDENSKNKTISKEKEQTINVNSKYTNIFETHNFKEIYENPSIIEDSLDISFGTQYDENITRIHYIKFPFSKDKNSKKNYINLYEEKLKNELTVFNLIVRLNIEKLVKGENINSEIDFKEFILDKLSQFIISIGLEIKDLGNNTTKRIYWLKKDDIHFYENINFDITSNSIIKTLGFQLDKEFVEENLENYITAPYQFYFVFKFPSIDQKLKLDTNKEYVSSLIVRLYNFPYDVFTIENLSFSKYNEDLIYIVNREKNIFFKFNSKLKSVLGFTKNKNLSYYTSKEFREKINNLQNQEIEIKKYLEENFKVSFDTTFKDILKNRIIDEINKFYKFIKTSSEYIFIRNEKESDTKKIVKIYSKIIGSNTTLKKNYIFD